MKGAEGAEVVELPPEGASSAEFDSRPVAVRFFWRLMWCDSWGVYVGTVDGWVTRDQRPRMTLHVPTLGSPCLPEAPRS